MVKHVQKTNPLLLSLIQELKQQAYKQDAPIWKDIATRFEKPARNWAEVNLDHINTVVSEKETALIPGKVLSSGMLSKKISIAAWSFSDKSLEKIKKAGAKSLTIQELMKNNPKGKDIRIVG